MPPDWMVYTKHLTVFTCLQGVGFFWWACSVCKTTTSSGWRMSHKWEHSSVNNSRKKHDKTAAESLWKEWFSQNKTDTDAESAAGRGFLLTCCVIPYLALTGQQTWSWLWESKTKKPSAAALSHHIVYVLFCFKCDFFKKKKSKFPKIKPTTK